MPGFTVSPVFARLGLHDSDEALPACVSTTSRLRSTELRRGPAPDFAARLARIGKRTGLASEDLRGILASATQDRHETGLTNITLCGII